MKKDTTIARRSAGWHILGWFVATALAGCAADVGGEATLDDGVAHAGVIERIDAETFAGLDADVQVWLDLRDPTQGYVVDTEAVPLERLSLMCPDGTVMGWNDWVAADAELVGRVQGSVGLAADLRMAELAAEQTDNPCPHDCYTCDDGATLCHPDWSCLEENDISYTGGSYEMERRLWVELWHGGYGFPSEPVPIPESDGEGDGDTDPTSPGGEGGGYAGSGSSGSDSGGSYGGSGGGSPGGHPGW